MVSWINHLPPAFWSTFWKLIFKQQLGCRFDIIDSISSFFYFDMCNYICLDTSYHFFGFICTSWIFFVFPSTPVLTPSIDVVFVLSISDCFLKNTYVLCQVFVWAEEKQFPAGSPNEDFVEHLQGTYYCLARWVPLSDSEDLLSAGPPKPFDLLDMQWGEAETTSAPRINRLMGCLKNAH